MSVIISLTDDIVACHALRRAVFIEEQGVSEAEEIDDLDDVCLHLLALDGDAPVGTARVNIQGGLAKIGRVCVVKSHRGTGLGAALIQKALEVSRGKAAQAKLGAQTHALGFYEKLGFVATGPIFDDAGIPHRDMVRDL
ncbi:GNAT family N-acetyltransferase [Sulfitobacter sp. M57]|uniref:GNAT family N-acetyltransferase n=1 Tax=unclassified Sulfitobacter TaxID=196795 RepID=UPI0023E1240E|nr:MULTISPECIES: GNAT family N-acetyltransferase [unclassified Sulfitobacter]MDF3415176.1 GNAT family N-acetyltransferase [Sulfitobacter sp. KE5]MDF3422657.1 GNAT family N-acetyltransferase [Sulfitobacter sp. KE43]MDF3433722.1 GNAT family N-acetyltransferase [Sulfitobacter sp. KE42]MDF3459362.1 GNAT family N-acetyltransferase [Sulfitobacter sp. S74]MDF3463261.1 GNAT family N-acetyltransferase [Sulfitobacter sp. Ks18]